MQIADSILSGEKAPSGTPSKIRAQLSKVFGFKVTVVLFVLVLAVFLSVSMFFWPHWVLSSFTFLFDYLPLTLPIATVLLTVALRPHELVTFEGLLRLAISFSVGLVSFAIWAFVAGQAVSQYILINSDKVLAKNHGTFLVIASFTWAGFCSIIAALAENDDGKRKQLWQTVQGAQLAVSVACCIFVPFMLLQSKAEVQKTTGQSFDTRQFIVSIPYRDASLNQHLGRSADPITECFIARHMQAKSPGEAIQKALAMMQTQDLVFNARPASDRRSNIEALETLIVAQEEH